MRRLSLLIAVALITFGIGIAAAYLWLIGRHPTRVPINTVVYSAPVALPKPAGITQERELSLYDFGGRQGCGGVYLKTEARRCEASVGKARDFIWKHWREKRRGYVIVKLGSEDAQSDAHIFIEPDELGVWHIAWRWERVFGMNVKPGEVGDMPDIRSVELKRATKKDYRFIAGASYLSFLGEDGNEVAYL